uniref:Uncharacterized protein n=1 Tax=Steinernema glaseri TaxID=37863 RepID=A0A1I7ZCN7_9BILA
MLQNTRPHNFTTWLSDRFAPFSDHQVAQPKDLLKNCIHEESRDEDRPADPTLISCSGRALNGPKLVPRVQSSSIRLRHEG